MVSNCNIECVHSWFESFDSKRDFENSFVLRMQFSRVHQSLVYNLTSHIDKGAHEKMLIKFYNPL